MKPRNTPPVYAQLVLCRDGWCCASCEEPVGLIGCLVRREGVLCRGCWRARAKSPAKPPVKPPAKPAPPPAPVYYAWEMVVAKNNMTDEETIVRVAKTEKAARRAAMMCPHAREVVSIKGMTEEQYRRAYGSRRRRL